MSFSSLCWRNVIFGLVVTFIISCRGDIRFRAQHHNARVYEKAPVGTYVTTVHTYDALEGALQDVRYNLLPVKDSAYFLLESTSGNISTKKAIDRKANESYQIIVAALHQGDSKLQPIKVDVTVYNTFTPKFDQASYRAEIHANVTIGTSVLRVEAHDSDPLDYNAEIYYSMERTEDSSYFILNEQTGNIFVRKKFKDKHGKLVFRVFAEDGGSPKRASDAQVEVTVKTISEPLMVQVNHTTETSVEICWRRPHYGHVTGYLIKYRESDQLDRIPSLVNLTTNASTKCTILENVSPWTDYQFRLYAWNTNETGLGSDIVHFGTRPNYCLGNICKSGDCETTKQHPGYICHCHQGYYGSTCENFDPCFSKPCENYGVCRNISRNMYECSCLNGFSGLTCNIFNPCAIRPSPCMNGGRCESRTSHTYHCICPLGYYGKMCQYFNPCFSSPCLNGVCHNISEVIFKCRCNPGYSGDLCETDVDECSAYPCQNGGTCKDGINSFRCFCKPGYRGKKCQITVRCRSEETTSDKGSDKGVFRWNETPHGETDYVSCPYGVVTYSPINKATRKCLLLNNGTVAWGETIDFNCREKGYQEAENITGELQLLTEDPNSLNAEKLANATKKIQEIVKYSYKDIAIAQSMFSVISNMLAVNQSVLDAADHDGITTGKLLTVIDDFVSNVELDERNNVSLETENIAVKAIKWKKNTPTRQVTFTPSYQTTIRRKEIRERRAPSGGADDNDSGKAAGSITLPTEAIIAARKQTSGDLRFKFIAYKNDKFFRQRRNCASREHCGQSELLQERYVIQASINNLQLSNLSEPVEYSLPSPSHIPVLCVYWKEEEQEWSTEGLWVNQTDNLTLCFSTHLTAFSILLDPDPEPIAESHQQALSLISYIGSGLSLLGLLLTIITYSLFRCLNRDHSGKILLNLCISMFLMNFAFLSNSIPFFRKELCTGSAILIHYFVLTTLSWMCIEAINIYQLLIHVFASAETRFMLKRFFAAWGIPLIIVGVTAGIDLKYYKNPNEYCMLSPANPYVYYISLLGPSCAILLINCTVFVMVSRVLFTPRMNTKPGIVQKKGTVTTAQIRGAFTVMVLLGITWVFGALAVKQLKLVFQYVFCIANSLQGLLIFIVRCLLFPEARCAWKQLLLTGTLKRHRGVPPGGSWYANSNSSQKQNGSTSTRVHSGNSDNAGTSVFNTNFWNSQKHESRTLPFPSKNSNQQNERKRRSSSNAAGVYGTTTYPRNSRELPPPLNDPTIVYIDEEDHEKTVEASHPSDVYKSLLDRPDYFSQELEKRNTLQRTVTTFLTGREGQRDTPTSSLLAESPHTEQSSMGESPIPPDQIEGRKDKKKKLSFATKEESPIKTNDELKQKVQPRMDSTEDRTEL
uniref:Cadherin EGF LAG seven-pass G-type receptor 2 n=1 Tax=Hadrurus spadix TaxID=141984 RepID=A0A1W7RAV2_9SCOR